MTETWAIVAKNETFVLRCEDPTIVHADEIKDKKVWQLDREPDIINGEKVDYNTGKIVFDIKHTQPGLKSAQEILVAEIKALTQELILADYPLWKQLNDRDLPIDDEGVKMRKAVRDIHRSWSNDLEDSLMNEPYIETFHTIREQLTKQLSSIKGR